MDHYAALGVSPNAGNAELNNAFKKKTNAIRAPPNNNITRRHTLLRNSALERKALKNSYNLLKNKGKRAEYNKTRKVTIPSKYIFYTYILEKLTTNEEKHPSFPGEKFDEKSISRFEEKVNTQIKHGLKLHGDIIVTSGIVPSSRMMTSGTSKFPIPAEYSDNIMYQVLINGYGKPDYTEYKLVPIRVFGNGNITLATEEERRKKFFKDINTYLEDGWKLYNGPVELQLNRNVTSPYEHRGYIYQAIVR